MTIDLVTSRIWTVQILTPIPRKDRGTTLITRPGGERPRLSIGTENVQNPDIVDAR